MRTVHALKGVSFTAYENDSIGVIGTNGSGKSTLMRAIVGLTTTSDGAIYAASRPSLLGVGAALIKDLSGDRNIILGGLAMGFTLEEIEENYDDIVSFAGLEKFVDLPMRAYSSGMTARLKFAIASVILTDPATQTVAIGLFQLVSGFQSQNWGVFSPALLVVPFSVFRVAARCGVATAPLGVEGAVLEVAVVSPLGAPVLDSVIRCSFRLAVTGGRRCGRIARSTHPGPGHPPARGRPRSRSDR